MRVAPCGLVVVSAFSFLSRDEQAELAFKLGCVSAVITHTHPSGWLSSGYQAALLARILSGLAPRLHFCCSPGFSKPVIHFSNFQQLIDVNG